MAFCVLSYNIVEGGDGRLPLIADVIGRWRGDATALLEANSRFNPESLSLWPLGRGRSGTDDGRQRGRSRRPCGGPERDLPGPAGGHATACPRGGIPQPRGRDR